MFATELSEIIVKRIVEKTKPNKKTISILSSSDVQLKQLNLIYENNIEEREFSGKEPDPLILDLLTRFYGEFKLRDIEGYSGYLATLFMYGNIILRAVIVMSGENEHDYQLYEITLTDEGVIHGNSTVKDYFDNSLSCTNFVTHRNGLILEERHEFEGALIPSDTIINYYPDSHIVAIFQNAVLYIEYYKPNIIKIIMKESNKETTQLINVEEYEPAIRYYLKR